MKGQVYQEFASVFALWLMVCAALYFSYSDLMGPAIQDAETHSLRQTAGRLAAVAGYAALLENAEYELVLEGTSNVSLVGPVIIAREKQPTGKGLEAGSKTTCGFSAFENASFGTKRLKAVSKQCYFNS